MLLFFRTRARSNRYVEAVVLEVLVVVAVLVFICRVGGGLSCTYVCMHARVHLRTCVHMFTSACIHVLDSASHTCFAPRTVFSHSCWGRNGEALAGHDEVRWQAECCGAAMLEESPCHHSGRTSHHSSMHASPRGTFQVYGLGSHRVESCTSNWVPVGMQANLSS